MTTREVIIQAIQNVAERLGEDLANVVFVGGTVAALYGDSKLDIRPTDDVDVITATTLPQYYAWVERLKERGFKQCLDEDAPNCRLVCAPALKVDVMPIDAAVLGFSNRWFDDGLKNAVTFELPSGFRVKALSPIHFVATKLEAFKGRGKGDFAASHDLEDVISLLGRMPEVLDLIETDSSAVAVSVLADLRLLSESEPFIDALPGFFLGHDEAQEVATMITIRFLRLRNSTKG